MLSDAAFKNLLADVKRILGAAKTHTTVDNNLVQSYWAIGKRIIDTGALDDAAFGDSLMKSLATRLGVDQRTLERSVVFSREYDTPPVGLTWAHYRELLKVSDTDERAYYDQLARDEGLSRDRLVLAIQSDVYSTKTRAKLKVQLQRPADVRYVYRASLVRIVDGDTLLLDIDLGFEVTKRQRVRLAAVNTFSSQSAKGQAASRFVAQRLALADEMVVHTKRADLHGRYLAHVFYSTRGLTFEDTFTAGHYLNQQLLDEKLAMRMR